MILCLEEPRTAELYREIYHRNKLDIQLNYFYSDIKSGLKILIHSKNHCASYSVFINIYIYMHRPHFKIHGNMDTFFINQLKNA